MEINTTSKQVLFTTIRIEVHDADGVRHGTGFFYQAQVDEKQVPFIVTNAHVVEDAASGILVFTQSGGGVPAWGETITEVVEHFEDHWHFHPTEDVAIMAFNPLIQKMKADGNEIYFRSISADIVLTGEELDRLDAIEEVVVVGYPDGRWDSINNLPIVRKGITATPAAVGYEGDRAFLVDAPIFVGSSGSPVFLLNVGAFSDGQGNVNYGTRVKFAGIITHTFGMSVEGELMKQPIPTAKGRVPVIQYPIDLGLVVRADAVVEFINQKARELVDLGTWRDRFGRVPDSYHRLGGGSGT